MFERLGEVSDPDFAIYTSLMTEREAKILVLGQAEIAGATCVEWFQESVPNFADFDVVYVDEVSLGSELKELHRGDEELKFEDLNRCRKWLANVKEGLVKLLATSGRIYAILGVTDVTKMAYFSTQFEKRRPAFLQASGWCPFPVERVDEKGDTITPLNEDFKDYFDEAVDSWSQTLKLKSEDMEFREDGVADHFDSTQGKRRLYKIAVNRQEQAVAAAFGYVGMRRNEGSNGRGGRTYGDEFDTGVVVLMPAPTKTDSRQALLLLMQTVAKNIGYPLHETWEDYENEKFRSKLPALVRPYFQTPQQLYQTPQPAPSPPAPSISAEDAEAIRLYERYRKLIAIAERGRGAARSVRRLPATALTYALGLPRAKWLTELAPFWQFVGVIATVLALIVAIYFGLSST
jgi:hypothetical protein